MKQTLKTKEITILAMFIVLDIILTRFLSINLWNIRIGFGFLPTIMVAHMYGTKFTIIECGVADIIGAILFPSGAFFIGFTISAVIGGVIWGYFLYKEFSMKKIIIAIILEKIICSLFITSVSISFLYGTPLVPIMIARIGQIALVSVFEIILIPFAINKICILFLKKGIL